MAGLICWNDTPSGSHGAFGPFSFVVSRVYGSDGNWVLVAHLPSMQDRRARGGLGEMKATAESWLREFASSLGALFAADLADHLTEQAAIHQDLGDGYSDSASPLAESQSHRYWGRAEALRDALKYLDHEGET